jgi:hypothetical protein
VDSAWPRIQPRLRAHPEVHTDNRRYAVATAAPAAVEQPPARPARTPSTPPPQPSPTTSGPALEPDLEGAARQRQERIDAVRALAELASEVEELAVNGAGPAALIHRVRSRVQRAGLEPIDRAGEEATFDRKRHKPISGAVRDGATVIIVRPGYVWKAPTEDVLIAKAIVEE